jgi:hypothetical protein
LKVVEFLIIIEDVFRGYGELIQLVVVAEIGETEPRVTQPTGRVVAAIRWYSIAGFSTTRSSRVLVGRGGSG